MTPETIPPDSLHKVLKVKPHKGVAGWQRILIGFVEKTQS